MKKLQKRNVVILLAAKAEAKKERVVKQDSKKWLKDLAQKLSPAELEYVQLSLKGVFEEMDASKLSSFEKKIVDSIKVKL